MKTEYYPLMTDRAAETTEATDRAVAGNALEHLSGAPEEPLNRRGRRHLASQMRRTDRSLVRHYHRERALERAGR
jgi:hypothetical protein